MPSPTPSPLESALVATFDALPDQLSRTIRHRIDPGWIEQVLRQGEGISVRRRKMPADVVVWLVLGACLFAGLSFVDVLKSFGLVPLTRRGSPQILPTSGAISQARARIGGETLAALFRITTGAWFKRPESQHLVFHGLRVCGIDGFTVRRARSIPPGGPRACRGVNPPDAPTLTLRCRPAASPASSCTPRA